MDWIHTILPLLPMWDDVVKPRKTARLLAQRDNQLFTILHRKNQFSLAVLHVDALAKSWMEGKLKHAVNVEEIVRQVKVLVRVIFYQESTLIA